MAHRGTGRGERRVLRVGVRTLVVAGLAGAAWLLCGSAAHAAQTDVHGPAMASSSVVSELVTDLGQDLTETLFSGGHIPAGHLSSRHPSSGHLSSGHLSSWHLSGGHTNGGFGGGNAVEGAGFVGFPRLSDVLPPADGDGAGAFAVAGAFAASAAFVGSDVASGHDRRASAEARRGEEARDGRRM